MEERRDSGRFSVSGMLTWMIVPVDCPLWILATYFCNFLQKKYLWYGYERVIMFLCNSKFSLCYPTKMSFRMLSVSGQSIFGIGQSVMWLTAATSLGVASTALTPRWLSSIFMGYGDGPIPGSIGEQVGAYILHWERSLFVVTGIVAENYVFCICRWCFYRMDF